METNSDVLQYQDADRLLSKSVADDLTGLLSVIKGRAYLLKQSVDKANPLQKHFDEIIAYVDESMASARTLSGFIQTDRSLGRDK